MNNFLDSKVGMVVAIAVCGVGVAYLLERKAAQVANAVSPTNPDNVFAEGVDNVGASLTGDKNFKLGAWIYDQIHGTTQEQLEAEQVRQKSQVINNVWAGLPEPEVM